LFVSISQVIGCEDRLRNDLDCVGWCVKLYSNSNVWNQLFQRSRVWFGSSVKLIRQTVTSLQNNCSIYSSAATDTGVTVTDWHYVHQSGL